MVLSTNMPRKASITSLRSLSSIIRSRTGASDTSDRPFSNGQGATVPGRPFVYAVGVEDRKRKEKNAYKAEKVIVFDVKSFSF